MIPNTPSSVLLKPCSLLAQSVGTLRFLAGDFGTGTGHLLCGGSVRIPDGRRAFPMSALSRVEVVTEESTKSLGGAVGWGFVAGALFGPLGILAGSVFGGQGTDVTFMCTLDDGKCFLAKSGSKVYARFAAACIQ